MAGRRGAAEHRRSDEGREPPERKGLVSRCRVDRRTSAPAHRRLGQHAAEPEAAPTGASAECARTAHSSAGHLGSLYNPAMRRALILSLAALIAVLTLTLVALVTYAVSVPAAGEPARDRGQPTPPELTIVAVGDSYMSGEGAKAFYRGTDRPALDKCRRAPTPYPVRVAKALHATLYFAACSGARTFNVGTPFPRSHLSPRPQRGERLQVQTLRDHPDADIVLLSIGGNDAEFSDIVALCAGHGDSCVPKAQPWLDNLDAGVQPDLRDVYAEVRTTARRTARVYVTLYPIPFGASVRSCAAIGMETDEVGFVRTFVERLNDEIRLAAADAGFGVIDLSTALGKGGLCDKRGEPRTLNAWRDQKPDGVPHAAIDVLRGSFHPTEHGHRLMARKVLARLAGAQAATAQRDAQPSPPPGPPPGVSAAGVSPPRISPPGVSRPGVPPTLPPGAEATEFGPPLPPFPQDPNPCTAAATKRDVVELDVGPDRVTGARPSSRVCYRTFQGEWHATRADPDGRATIPFGRASKGVGGWRRVLYRDRSGHWVQQVVRPGPSAAPPKVSIGEAWLTTRTATLITALVLTLLVTIICALLAARVIVDTVLP